MTGQGKGMIGVDFPRELDCMRCGAPTSGRATCELCFEAITELRALAQDHDDPFHVPVRPSQHVWFHPDTGRIASVDLGE
jgi:hypothetical protein